MEDDEPVPGSSKEEPKKKRNIKKSKNKEPKVKPPPLPAISVTEQGVIHVRPPKSPKPVKPTVIRDDTEKSEGLTVKMHKKPKKLKVLSLTSKEEEIKYAGILNSDFLNDDKSPIPTWRHAKDLIGVALDEVALEGLDGITLEALWTRLSITLAQSQPFSNFFENHIWEGLKLNPDLNFYELHVKRPKLVIYDRYQNFNPETGYIMDKEDGPDDIYTFMSVQERVNGITGSCAVYKERVCISNTIRGSDLKTIEERYGNKMVIVANQMQREFSLIPQITNPLVIGQLNDMQYCLLERIGRSRRIGELTCGSQSLATIYKDPKTLFYYRKILHKNQLITKQQFCLHRPNKQNTIGNLFHLHRFFNERKSRKQSIIEHVIKLLKSRPKFRMEYMELRRMLGENWEKLGLTKLVKSNEFKQYVRTDLCLMYREVYPKATEAEWKRKACSKEKSVRVFELINPNINVNAITKDDDQKDSSSDEDAHEHLAFNIPMAKQGYEIIYKSGSNGVFLRELKSLVSTDFYSVRGLTKALMKCGLIYSSMVDAGRQRYTKFYATCFKNNTSENLSVREIKPYIEEDHDDNTLDFIADILQINASYLKGKRAEQQSFQPPQNPLKGRYDEIHELRQKNKELNEIEKFRARFSEDITENLERLERKRIIQSIYLNNHSFIDHKTSLNEGIISRFDVEARVDSSEFTKVVSGIFMFNKSKPSSVFPNKIKPNEASIDPILETKLKKDLRVFATKKIRKFSRYLKKVLIKQPNSLAKNYKTYLQQYRILMETMVQSANDKSEHTLLLSTDDEECDADSLNVNLEESDIYKSAEPVPSEIKKALIENFQTDAPLLSSLGDAQDFEFVAVSMKNARNLEEEETDDTQRVNIKKFKSEEKSIDELFKLEMYMGPAPITVSNSLDEDNIQTKVMISSKPEDFGNIKQMTLSERVEKRCELIKEAVFKHRIIPDITKLLQMLIVAEKTEGYSVKVDRKSLYRIYTKLVREGAIKMVKILVKYENIVRSKTIMVYPNVDIQSFIDSAIEQFKMSFFIYAKRKVLKIADDVPTPTIKDEKEVLDIVQKTSVREQTLDAETGNKVKYRYSRTVGKTYGYYPKIAKMRVLHEFLYYLLYGYDGKIIPDEEVAQVLSQHCDYDDKLAKECSTLYQSEASWKMFIPPIPVHKTWSSGWLLICDALLRLPISIFVKIFNVAYIIPELPKYYLNHPVRKHFLVKNLPPDTRDAILNYRKYIFSIYEVFCYLCYLGLLQFGPQKFREKDQQFVYLNKKAILFETSSSEAGYHHITTSDYPKLSYTFESAKDVEKYWGDMYNICMHTKLGQRTSVLGSYISLENIHGKTAMVEALKHQTPESVLERDVGYLPGDGLGACCADSALWLHVRRNWIWSTQKNMPTSLSSAQPISGIRKKHMDEIKPIKFLDYVRNSLRKSGKTRNTEQKFRKIGKKKIIKSNTMHTKKKAILRKVKPRKAMTRRCQVDLVDRGILDKMGKSRAVFCPEEDNLILLCKAVCEFLCTNFRKRSVVNSALRDFIHRILPYSRKTSKAYKRRYMQLKKTENVQDEQKPFSFNLNSDYFTQKHFKKQKDKLDGSTTVSEIEISLTFLYLAYFTYNRWKATRTNTVDNLTPDVKDYLTVSNIIQYEKFETVDDEECVYQDPISEDDINLDTIKSVIHSSLGCQNANHEWPYRLLKVYQSFSENLLRTALNILRDQQLISGKRVATKHSGCKEGSILMRGTSYHLSFVYTFKQITKYPNYIYNEAHDFFMLLYKHLSEFSGDGKSIENINQGHGLGISEVAVMKKVGYVFELADDMISLNPNGGDCNDLIKELALRYQTLMFRKNQDNENEDNPPEPPDVCQRLETILEVFIKSQFNANVDQKEKMQEEVQGYLGQIFGNAESEIKQEQGKEDDGLHINIDRRQKGLRISDLAFLLTKGLFPELDDDDRLEKLNKHFLVKYPTCKLRVEDEHIMEGDFLYRACHRNIIGKCDDILEKLKKMCIVNNTMPKDEEIREAILQAGGNARDFIMSEKLVHLVYSKGVYGVSSKDIIIEFSVRRGNLDVDEILRILLELGVILRFGICNFAFVHFSYRHTWTIYLDSSKHPDFSSDGVGFRVKISPWIRIDGTVHISVLLNWLNIILSHCLSYPFIPLPVLCKRFCYIKPVDIFYLLEFLQDLSCLKICTYVKEMEEDLFHDSGEICQVPTKITDDFANIFIETDNMAIIKFGAFIDKDKTNFTSPFEE